MRAATRTAGARRPQNVSMPEQLVREAKALGINISQACERGLAEAVAAARRQRWLDENRQALDSSNAFAESQGLPLGKYRQF